MHIATSQPTCLVPPAAARFNIAKKYWHDVTLSGGAELCVVHRGKGLDLNVDYHRAGEARWRPAALLCAVTGPILSGHFACPGRRCAWLTW